MPLQNSHVRWQSIFSTSIAGPGANRCSRHVEGREACIGAGVPARLRKHSGHGDRMGCGDPVGNPMGFGDTTGRGGLTSSGDAMCRQAARIL